VPSIDYHLVAQQQLTNQRLPCSIEYTFCEFDDRSHFEQSSVLQGGQETRLSLAFIVGYHRAT